MAGYFWVTLCLFVLLVSPVATATLQEEIEAYLKTPEAQEVLDFFPLGLSLEECLRDWSRPSLGPDLIEQGWELLHRKEEQGNDEVEDLVQRAYLHLLLQEEEQARTLFTEALERGQRDGAVLRPLLYMQSSEGTPEEWQRIEAIWQEESLPMQPLHYGRALFALQTGEEEQVDTHLRRALQLGGFGPPAVLRGQRALERGELELARQLFEEALNHGLEDPVIHLFLAVIPALEGAYETAFEKFSRLPSLQDLSGRYRLFYLAIVDRVDREKALLLWEEQEEIPGLLSREEIELYRLFSLLNLDQEARVKREMEAVQERDLLHDVLEYHLYKEEEPQKAIVALEYLLEALGKTPEMYRELAHLKEDTEDIEGAFAIWKGLRKTYTEAEEPKEEERRMREEQGLFWWTTQGMWISPVKFSPGPGNAAPLFLTEDPLYTRNTSLVLDLPPSFESFWFSADGLHWEWLHGPQGTVQVDLPPSLDNYFFLHLRKPGFSPEYYVQKVILDQKPPHCTVTLPPGASPHTSTREMTLQLKSKDVLSPVLEYRLGEGEEDWGPWQPLAESISFTLSQGPDGTRVLRAQVRDKAGNVSPESVLELYLNREPPVVKDLSLHAITTSSARLRLQATEEVEVVVYISPVKGGPLQEYKSRAFSLDHEVRLENLRPDTEYMVVVEVKDRAGNYGEDSFFAFRTRRQITGEG